MDRTNRTAYYFDICAARSCRFVATTPSLQLHHMSYTSSTYRVKTMHFISNTIYATALTQEGEVYNIWLGTVHPISGSFSQLKFLATPVKKSIDYELFRDISVSNSQIIYLTFRARTIPTKTNCM